MPLCVSLSVTCYVISSLVCRCCGMVFANFFSLWWLVVGGAVRARVGGWWLLDGVEVGG